MDIIINFFTALTVISKLYCISVGEHHPDCPDSTGLHSSCLCVSSLQRTGKTEREFTEHSRSLDTGSINVLIQITSSTEVLDYAYDCAALSWP